MPTLLTTPGGERLVILPEGEYRDQMAAVAGRKAGPDVIVPADVANRIFAGEHPVRVYREWRGLTGKDLAAKAGTSGGHLSDIESGCRSASAETRAALAAVLGLEADDLVPANMDRGGGNREARGEDGPMPDDDAAAYMKAKAALASGAEELLTSDEVAASLAAPTPLASGAASAA